MERAIKHLCQLPDDELFEEVATGVRHVVEVVTRLDAAAHKLTRTEDHHAARILGGQAQEEAAKVLILMDAVRCPREQREDMSRTLGYFYSHLAKGIYVEVCHWSTVDFAEIARGVEDLRDEHHLDGPTDADWIFPNPITQRREDDLYVGYVRDDSDEDGRGERGWTRPTNDGLLFYWTPPIVELTRALHRVGATDSDALAAVAELWRPFDVGPDTPVSGLKRMNLRTLEVLEERGLLAFAPDDVYALIPRNWPFPLWPLDLRLRRVKKESRRKVRRRWTPEL